MVFVGYCCYIMAIGLVVYTFSKGLQKRWEISLLGSMGWGCLTPIALVILAKILFFYQVQPMAIPKSDPLKIAYSKAKTLPKVELKKLISDNYKGLLHNPKELRYLQKLLNSILEEKRLENDKLLQELAVLRKLQMAEEQRQYKIQKIKKRGKINEQRMVDVQSVLDYLNSIFGGG